MGYFDINKSTISS